MDKTAGIERIGMIDSHADTITAAMDSGQELGNNNLHLDLKRLKKFGAPVQVFAICTADGHASSAFEYANAAIDFFEKALDKHSDVIAPALSAEDIYGNADKGKISAVLAIEGAEPLEGKIERLEHFHKRGVRLITLTWNRENELGHGVFSGSEDGLKPFGEHCVKRMNELGIIIDVSHLNEAGFRDVHRLSTRPFVASHSNAYTVAPHIRNLKDWQIMSIAGIGGIIGLNLCPDFLSGSEKAGLNDIMKHIEHFSELGVIDCLGLGADFDGVDYLPEGIEDVSSMAQLERAITDSYGKKLSSAIMCGNFYEFLMRVL